MSKQKDLEPISLQEAVWLIKSEIKTARELGKEIDLDGITEESVAQSLRQYRGIEIGYAMMEKGVLDKTEH